ncbi:bacterio-opsin activator domain-containing protein [Halovivax gelatinilyticus]|uniref:bacterio-opsin activator domain-containing protein n=1 Tax=Halovivax gelatinilyticus TaxID=2961597 RepID=UPI0020CA6740|nr:bacterio-opsin activator domain-containing protein [Halovivax gelatinilyticus]
MTRTDPLDILVVEDNPGDVRLIEELLEEAMDHPVVTGEREENQTHAVYHADRLADGIERLDEYAVDVVLLDLGLPDSTGIATLERVLERSRDTAIVVLTGLDDETVGVQAVTRGAQEYLVKDELTPALLGRSLRHAIERKKFERTQTALHDASRDLIQAESAGDVCRLVVDTAVEALDLPSVAIYLYDDASNELRPAAFTEYVSDRLGTVPSFGPNDTAITWQSFITDETIAHEDVLDSPHVHRRDSPFRSGIWIPLGDHGVFTIVSESIGGIDQQTQQLADHLAATAEATLDRVEREQSVRRHERELAQQNRKLEALNRMNGLIREIDQVLVEATTRAEIEGAVCDRLTRDERFEFAWIGDDSGGADISPRTWAGVDDGYLDAISLSLAEANPPPSVEAMTTGSVTQTANIGAELGSAPWRKAALARNFQSVIAIPLTYAEITYGVLTVFATDPNAFDDRSAEMFAELGETIANAMNAVETRQALLTDTVVELELTISEPDDLLVRVAREADCRIEYGGIVPQADGSNRLFFTAAGASAETIQDVAADVPSIQSVDWISDGAEADGGTEQHRFEVTASGQTIPSTLVEVGAITRSVVATGSTVDIVVELPDTTDIRTFIDRLENTYPETELIARRDKERSDRSHQAIETILTTELTDRQLEVLQTAFHSGYFEWPRDRTGEEVAASLDITQPTFNGHLRAAERKLCAVIFGPEAATEH